MQFTIKGTASLISRSPPHGSSRFAKKTQMKINCLKKQKHIESILDQTSDKAIKGIVVNWVLNAIFAKRVA